MQKCNFTLSWEGEWFSFNSEWELDSFLYEKLGNLDNDELKKIKSAVIFSSDPKTATVEKIKQLQESLSKIEANKKYNDGITWKKAAHKKFGTQLLVTSSADFHYSDIRDKLRKLLYDAGVPIQEKTDEELYELVLPKGSKQEKAFIRLVVTFVTLIKSSCKSLKEVLKHTAGRTTGRNKLQDRMSLIKVILPRFDIGINLLFGWGEHSVPNRSGRNDIQFWETSSKRLELFFGFL